MKTGKLYGIMIYRMTGSYDDQAIILADSGMLQSTAEKKHILITLWSGEWFENMPSQQLGNSASVPYRRESFSTKQIVMDYDGDFNMTDAASLSNDARGKSLRQIGHDIDSLNHMYDSIGRRFYADSKMGTFYVARASKPDSLTALKRAQDKSFSIDAEFDSLSTDKKQRIISMALNKVQMQVSELDFNSMITSDADKLIRQHQIEAINKFTLALSCLIFFFIGAPLGAIIRKGGLGIPVIISVLVFIIFYILDNTGYRMSRGGMWTVWFGKGLAPAVLTPLAVFFTYKANNDSVVFNLDMYKNLMMKMLGLRLKRHVFGKEVIIDDPDYVSDKEKLNRISQEVTDYSKVHNLHKPANIINVFFRYQPDHEIERISQELEAVIEDLANTKDKVILSELNNYPILSEKAHTRPFERKWMNIAAAIIVPIGAFLYIRMWTFRLRLLHDLRTIKQTNTNIENRIQHII